MIDYNAVNFGHFLLTECYTSIIISTVSFTSLYLFIHYILAPRIFHTCYGHNNKENYPKLQWKAVDASISMVHSIIILTLCAIHEDTLSLSVTQQITDTYTTNKERMIASISIGYFIYDLLVYCIIFCKKDTVKIDKMYILHHLIAIIGLTICIITIYSGYLPIICLFLHEITNPLLHLNEIRNKLSNRSQQITIFDFCIKLLYVILFCIARFIILGHMMYQTVFIFKCSVYIQIEGVILIILSLILLPALLRDLSITYDAYKNAENLSYSVVDQLSSGSTNVEMTENEEKDDEENGEELYIEILSLSKKSVFQFFVAGTVYSFFHTNRMSIYVLYAEEFNPTMLQIAFMLYGYNFWNGIASLLYSALANCYGYDVILIGALILQCIAVFLESISTGYYMLLVGIILGQVAITYIVFGYIAWMLPHKYATAYTSYFYAAFMVSYLIGPMSAGFISFYLSNRTVFFINFILCLCALIHALTFIAKTQKKLEGKQLRVELLSEKEDDEQFPICLDRYREIEDDDDDYNDEDELEWYQVPPMSIYQWFMLSCIIFINSTVSIGESCFVIYYSLYIINDLNGNVIQGTCGIVIMSIGFMIGNLIIPKWLDMETNNQCLNQLKNKYIILIICIFFGIFHVMFLFPFIKQIRFYWLFDFTIGLSLGILSMTSEIVILEIQPTKYCGKVSGAKGLIRNWLMAITLLFVSLWWDITHNSFYYVVGISWSLALLPTVGMMLATYKHDNILNTT